MGNDGLALRERGRDGERRHHIGNLRGVNRDAVQAAVGLIYIFVFGNINAVFFGDRKPELPPEMDAGFIALQRGFGKAEQADRAAGDSSFREKKRGLRPIPLDGIVLCAVRLPAGDVPASLCLLNFNTEAREHLYRQIDIAFGFERGGQRNGGILFEQRQSE